jgi:hypothetical protein
MHDITKQRSEGLGASLGEAEAGILGAHLQVFDIVTISKKSRLSGNFCGLVNDIVVVFKTVRYRFLGFFLGSVCSLNRAD